MPRLRIRARTLVNAVRMTIKTPNEVQESLDTWPWVSRGAQFGEQVACPTGAPAGNGNSAVPNILTTYFDANLEGPGIWKWRHYFDIYHRHFSRFVGREVHVLEIGIYSGGSLPMWHHYFGAQCHVYGVDIEPACLQYKGERTEVFIGDQSDRSFWAKVRQGAPTIDVLIDDGGHTPTQQLVTLEEMLPHIRPGGVYFCEDVHGASNLFAAYVHGLSNNLNTTTPAATPDGGGGLALKPSRFQAAIESIHHYPFVTVIEKRKEPLDLLSAPKHGTEWQPYRCV
jgi:hypothetical protein